MTIFAQSGQPSYDHIGLPLTVFEESTKQTNRELVKQFNNAIKSFMNSEKGVNLVYVSLNICILLSLIKQLPSALHGRLDLLSNRFCLEWSPLLESKFYIII